MLNVVWLSLILLSVLFGIANGTLSDVVKAVTDSTKSSIELSISLAGMMMFWLGLMKIAEKSGLIILFSKVIRPLLHWLFPEVPLNHPAMGSMIMNIAANMLGLNNAATPIGLRAMSYLQTLNDDPKTASNAMCTFLAINTSSIQLLPTTAIAFLAAAGAHHPTKVIATALIATTCSTIAAIIAVKVFEKLPRYRLRQPVTENQKDE